MKANSEETVIFEVNGKIVEAKVVKINGIEYLNIHTPDFTLLETPFDGNTIGVIPINWEKFSNFIKA